MIQYQKIISVGLMRIFKKKYCLLKSIYCSFSSMAVAAGL